MEPGEHIIFIAHKHIIAVLPFIVAAVIVAGLSGALAVVLPVQVGAALMLITAIAALLAIVAFVVYRQNTVTLTNIHFIKVEQNGLFGRFSASLTLDELEDVNSARIGIVGTILDYGTLTVQTAGARQQFVFGPVARSARLAELVEEARDAYKPVETVHNV